MNKNTLATLERLRLSGIQSEQEYIEQSANSSADESRTAIKAAIKQRYTLPA